MRRDLDRFRQSYTGKYEEFIKENVDGFADRVIVLKIIPTIQLHIFMYIKMMEKIEDNIRNGTAGWPEYDFNDLLSLEASRAYPVSRSQAV